MHLPGTIFIHGCSALVNIYVTRTVFVRLTHNKLQCPCSVWWRNMSSGLTASLAHVFLIVLRTQTEDVNVRQGQTGTGFWPQWTSPFANSLRISVFLKIKDMYYHPTYSLTFSDSTHAERFGLLSQRFWRKGEGRSLCEGKCCEMLHECEMQSLTSPTSYLCIPLKKVCPHNTPSAWSKLKSASTDVPQHW